MRVAYASDDLGPHDQRLLKAAAARHEVHLLTFFNRAQALPAWIARDCPSVRVHHRRFEAYPEVPSTAGRLRTALARRRDERRYLAAFAEGLKAIRPDLLHAGWIQSTGWAAALSGFHPLFLMPWGSDVLVWPKRSRRDRAKARLALRAADGVACDAETVKAEILALSGIAPDRIRVFPWGVDLDRFRPLEGASEVRRRLGWEGSPVVVMTRQMREVYGVLEFARGFGRVLARTAGARLLLVGDGHLRPQVEEALSPLGPCWHAAGAVENAGMPSFLQAGDVYASFSFSDGASVSLLEAMACGLPAVVTDLPANREWVVEGVTGFLVPPGDLEAMAERLGRLLADRALRRAMGERALAVARERADWRINAGTMLSCYEEALNLSPRASFTGAVTS